jgi:hypothetical protein
MPWKSEAFGHKTLGLSHNLSPECESPYPITNQGFCQLFILDQLPSFFEKIFAYSGTSSGRAASRLHKPILIRVGSCDIARPIPQRETICNSQNSGYYYF